MGFKGPKQLLASAIAAALRKYFELDEELIEAELIKEAKLALKDVKLRPQSQKIDRTKKSSNTNSSTNANANANANANVNDDDDTSDNNNDIFFMEITGSVKEVSFKWTWDLSQGDCMWMKDISLTIRGLELKVQLSIGEKTDHVEEEQLQVTPESVTKSESESEDAKRNKEEKLENEGIVATFIKNQVEQMIDALTLIVTDFKFTIVLPPVEREDGNENIMRSSGITVGGKQLELRSQGRKAGEMNDVLLQQCNIGSFYIDTFDIDENDNVTPFPILEPTWYQATATKKGGKRFQSLGKGLVVQGKILSGEQDFTHDASDITFHLGTAQIRILSQLVSFMIKKQSKNDQHQNGDNNVTITKEIAIEKETPRIRQSLIVLKEKVSKSSQFIIPIASISLVLPNNTKVKLQSFTINYRANGGTLTITGADGAGIMVDDYPVITTKCDDSTGIKTHWMVDLVSNHFSIQDNSVDADNHNLEGKEGCHIQICPDVLKRVIDGLKTIAGATASSFPQNKEVSNHPEPPAASKTSSAWLIDFERTIEITIASDRELKPGTDWMKIKIDSPSIVFPLGTSTLKCENLIIGPFSRGALLIKVPRIFQIPPSNTICIGGEVSLIDESQTNVVIDGIVSLVQKFTQALESDSNAPQQSSPENVEQSITKYPLQIDIPSINVNLFEGNLIMHLTGATITPTGYYCKKLILKNCWNVSATCLQVTGTFLPLEISVGIVENLILHFLGLESLEHITNLIITFDDMIFGFKIKRAVLILRKMADGPPCDPPTIYLGFEVSIDQAMLKRDEEQSNERKTEISLQGFFIATKPNNSPQLYGYLPHHITFVKAKTQLFELPRIDVAFLFNFRNKKNVKDMKIQIPGVIRIYAGHTVSDYVHMLLNFFDYSENGDTDVEVGEPCTLPDVYISPLRIFISYKFSYLPRIVTKVKLAEFQGNENTELNDLVGYYKTNILNGASSLFEDAALNVKSEHISHPALLLADYNFRLGA